jgi:hypothetical protein
MTAVERDEAQKRLIIATHWDDVTQLLATIQAAISDDLALREIVLDALRDDVR